HRRASPRGSNDPRRAAGVCAPGRRRGSGSAARPGAAGTGHRHLLAAHRDRRRHGGAGSAGRRRTGAARRRDRVARAGGAAHLLLSRRRNPDRDGGLMKPINQRAWLLVLPVVICVAFSAILPLMTVVNYSVQDIISPERRVFVGTEWFVQVMRDQDLHAALLRQLGYSLAVLLVEIPLGIALALSMPAQGWKASAVPLVLPPSRPVPCTP